ncbi:MAG: SURF1 family protein [Gemmatimonadota bacterium]
MSSVRRWIPFALALPLVALFASLGMWQLQRLGDRRAANRLHAAALQLPVLEFPYPRDEEPLSAEEIVGRRVRLTGTWAPEQELVVRGQAYLGTPGVNVLTPLVVEPDQAILVLRGWLPAADGLSADLRGAVPVGIDETVVIQGLARAGQRPVPIPIRAVRFEDRDRFVLGDMDIAAADSLIPLELADFVVQLLPDGPAGDRRPGLPVPLPAPALNDGPHALYAFQWFGFALIALAGAILLPRAGRIEPRITPGPGESS